MPPPTISLPAFFPRLAARLPECWLPALAGCEKRAALFRRDAMAVLELALRRPLPPQVEATPLLADFSVRLEEPGQCLDETALPPAVAALFAARAAGDFPAAWMPSVWLEYDLRDAAGRPPIVCFRIGAEAPLAWLQRELLAALGCGLAPATLAAAGDALATLPAEARPLYLFDLAPRGRPGLRLELAAEPAALEPWLASLGADAQADQLRHLASLWRGGDRPHVSFDFDGKWQPRVGLENSFRGQPPGEERWARQLAALTAAGLASEEQKEALLAWPGVETPGHPDWPAQDGRPLPGWLVTCLSHLKLAQAPGSDLEVKAYLLFQYLAREVRTWPSR